MPCYTADMVTTPRDLNPLFEQKVSGWCSYDVEEEIVKSSFLCLCSVHKATFITLLKKFWVIKYEKMLVIDFTFVPALTFIYPTYTQLVIVLMSSLTPDHCAHCCTFTGFHFTWFFVSGVREQERDSRSCLLNLPPGRRVSWKQPWMLVRRNQTFSCHLF